MKISDKTASIYVIQNLELDRVKIGYSNDPLKRFAGIRSQSGCEMKLYYSSMPILDYESVELVLHDFFDSHRGIGEWFNLHPDIAVSKIKEIIGDSELCDIVKFYNSGMNPTQIAGRLDVSRTAIIKYLKRYNIYDSRRESKSFNKSLDKKLSIENSKILNETSKSVKSEKKLSSLDIANMVAKQKLKGKKKKAPYFRR